MGVSQPHCSMSRDSEGPTIEKIQDLLPGLKISALDRFAAYIFAKKFKMAQKETERDSRTCQKCIVFVFLKSSSFPPKRAKNVVSTRKSRQQTGLKAKFPMRIKPPPPKMKLQSLTAAYVFNSLKFPPRDSLKLP